MPTPLMNFRCSAEMRTSILERAAAEGGTITDVIVDALAAYLQTPITAHRPPK